MAQNQIQKICLIDFQVFGLLAKFYPIIQCFPYYPLLSHMRDLGPSTGVPGTEFRRATLLKKSEKVILGSGRASRGAASHSKNGSEKHEIVMEMGWCGGLGGFLNKKVRIPLGFGKHGLAQNLFKK